MLESLLIFQEICRKVAISPHIEVLPVVKSHIILLTDAFFRVLHLHFRSAQGNLALFPVQSHNVSRNLVFFAIFRGIPLETRETPVISLEIRVISRETREIPVISWISLEIPWEPREIPVISREPREIAWKSREIRGIIEKLVVYREGSRVLLGFFLDGRLVHLHNTCGNRDFRRQRRVVRLNKLGELLIFAGFHQIRRVFPQIQRVFRGVRRDFRGDLCSFRAIVGNLRLFFGLSRRFRGIVGVFLRFRETFAEIVRKARKIYVFEGFPRLFSRNSATGSRKSSGAKDLLTYFSWTKRSSSCCVEETVGFLKETGILYSQNSLATLLPIFSMISAISMVQVSSFTDLTLV